MKLIRLVDTGFSDQSAFETIYFQDERASARPPMEIVLFHYRYSALNRVIIPHSLKL